MLLDGIFATQTGHYIGGTPGLWASVVTAAGIDPRSYMMHGIFMVYGLAWLGAVAYSYSGRHAAMIAMALFTLWYVPFGTLLSLIILGIAFWNRFRTLP